MQVQDWNNCFLCLNEITLSAREKEPLLQTHSKIGGFEVVFKYLLDTQNETYEQVLKEILQAIVVTSPEICTPYQALQFCSECQDKMEQVVKLHEQLEVLQMKIIAGLKKIKEIVMANSNAHGTNAGRLKLQFHEEWLAENEIKGMVPPIERKILNLLSAFQKALFEKEKCTQDVPFVLLKKHSFTTPMTNAHVLQFSNSDVDYEVKTEPLDIDDTFNTIGSPSQERLSVVFNDDFPFDDAVSDEELFYAKPSNSDSHPPKKRAKVGRKVTPTPVKEKLETTNEIKPKKRGRPRKVIVEPFCDDADPEICTQQHSITTGSRAMGNVLERKSRSAATAANCRIAQIQNAENDESSTVEKKPLLKRTVKIRDVSSEGTNPISSGSVLKTQRKIGTKKKIVESKIRKKPGRKRKVLLPFATKSGEKGLQKGCHKTMYSCQTENCTFTTISAYKFEHHLRDHETDEKRLTCQYCSMAFSGKQYCEFHTAMHEGYNKIQCDLCSTLFLAVDLADHMKTHGEKIFPCPNCSHCTSTREKYLGHLHQHHGMKGKWVCDICNLTCRSRRKLFAHLFYQHKAIEEIVCDFQDCGRTFLDQQNLSLHRKIHTQPFACNECHEVFSDDNRLKVHLMRHTGEKPYKCGQCSESFYNNDNLQNHCIRSHGAEKYKCEICSKEYLCRSSLQYHMTTHDGTAIPCGFPGCTKSFPSKGLLTRHQATHSDERNHVCAECGMQFKTLARLTMHTKIHVNDRKFKCSHCDKAFILKKYLVNHVRIHTGEKPFVCDLCGKDFNQYAALYQHKKKHLGSAAPPVNPEYGRPRAKQSLQEKQRSSTYFEVPGEMSHAHSLEHSSFDNDSKPSQL